MSDIPLEKQFNSMCKKLGIAPRSHDESIARVSWKIAIDSLWEEIKNKNNKETTHGKRK